MALSNLFNSVGDNAGQVTGHERYEISLQIDEEFEHLCDDQQLMVVAQRALLHQGVTSGALAVVLTDDSSVQTLNRDFRQIDSPTDVLSFPNYESPGQDFIAAKPETHAPNSHNFILPDEFVEEEADYLGDVIIAVPYTQIQAQSLGRSLADELELLVVHGILHLLGFDHATEDDEAEMWDIQRRILEGDQ